MNPIPCLLSLFVPCCLAFAQTCAVKGHFRIVNSVSGMPPSELRLDSGWQTTAPLVMPGSNSGFSPQGCFSSGTCTTVSDYGFLRVSGTGSAANCSSGGVFLWLTEWIGGEPKARFRDRLTVVAPGLPIGTPVQLRCTARLVGSANVVGSVPSVAYGVELYVNNTLVLNQANAAGTVTTLVTVAAGAQVPIAGHLAAQLSDSGVMSGTPHTASYALDLAVTFDLTPVTAGVALTACSGAAYNGLAARATPVGSGCGAVPPALAASTPVLGSTCTLTTTGAPANALTVVGLALGLAMPTAIGPCVLQLDPATTVAHDIGIASGSGQFASTLAIPTVLSLLALPLTAQALPLLPGGPFLGLGELSNGVELQVGY